MKIDSDLHQTPEWSDFMSRLGWKIEEIYSPDKSQTCRVFIKDIPIFGSIVKTMHPAFISFEKLDELARRRRALFIKLEPGENFPNENVLAQHGYLPDNWPLCPTKVVRVDLHPSAEELWGNFAKDARYSIRKAERNGVTLEVIPLKDAGSKTIQTFYKIFKSTGQEKGFWIPPKKELEAKVRAFKDKGCFILARFGQDEYLSGALIIFAGKTVYYEHAAATVVGRKLLAQYLVIWELIKMAKDRGCELLDLGGVADPRFKISRRWGSLSVFKSKFCGVEATYPGSFTKYYNPLIKLLFKFNV